MKKLGIYVTITFLGIVAVFLGNVLFTEYQSYKEEREMKEIAETERELELERARERAKVYVNFNKPNVSKDEEKWEIKIGNNADVFIYGSVTVELYDNEDNVLVSDLVYLDSSGLIPYGEFIYVGHISEEDKEKVSNYKILDFEMYALE